MIVTITAGTAIITASTVPFNKIFRGVILTPFLELFSSSNYFLNGIFDIKIIQMYSRVQRPMAFLRLPC